MAAEEDIEFQISDSERDPELIAAAATEFLFENARVFLEKDEDFNKLHERSKEPSKHSS